MAERTPIIVDMETGPERKETPVIDLGHTTVIARILADEMLEAVGITPKRSEGEGNE